MYPYDFSYGCMLFALIQSEVLYEISVFGVGYRDHGSVSRREIETVISRIDAFEIDKIFGLLHIETAVFIAVHDHDVSVRTRQLVDETAFNALIAHVDDVVFRLGIGSRKAV